MIVYEFYLKAALKDQAFEKLCDTFYLAGNMVGRWDKPTVSASCVYAVSRNPATGWVQLLVDDNAPATVLNVIEARIKGLCDTAFTSFKGDKNDVGPPERPRVEVGV